MIQDAKLMAQSLISRYTTNNPFEIADALDYIVLFVPLCGSRGFHQYIKRNHIIYIDDSLSEEDQRWVCAMSWGISSSTLTSIKCLWRIILIMCNQNMNRKRTNLLFASVIHSIG